MNPLVPSGAIIGIYFQRARRWMLWCLAGMGVGAMLALGIVFPAGAQGPAARATSPQLTSETDPLLRSIDRNQPMLLEADKLIYDSNRDRVSAIGNVQIYYDRYALEADRVIYDRRAMRLIAEGNARLTDPDGYVMSSDKINLDDKFRDGFVQYVLLETPDRTRFAATSAVRTGGRYTVLRKGVYTACEPCVKNPGKPPSWQIKAEEIIHDQKQKTVHYRNGAFELFGLPLFYFPYFQHPDPSVKRKSGFLIPEASLDDKRGAGLAAPYFWALAPHYDLTFTPHVFSKQGFLGEVEWRHRTHSGAYFINVNGLYQLKPEAFLARPGHDTNWRASVFSEGNFSLNDAWSWGWELYAPSDVHYFADYEITKADAIDARSSLYLTGLKGRNFFEARTNYYRITRDDDLDRQEEQAIVHPVVDYNVVFDRPVLTGELGFNINVTSLTHREHDCEVFLFRDKTNFTRRCRDPKASPDGVSFHKGLKGTTTRASMDLHWRKQIITHMGLVLTPFASVQTDLSWLSVDTPVPNRPGFYDANETFVSAINPSVGVNIRWPWISSHPWGNQVFTPEAQIIASRDVTTNTKTPNNDAHSLVFDDSNLFQESKFSGFDRREGGVRGQVALHYKLLTRSGGFFDAMVGQAFHLGGDNAFAGPSLTNIGKESGLETSVSDVVARAYYQPDPSLQLGVRGRFARKTFRPKRIEALANLNFDTLKFNVGYAFLEKQPGLGIHDRRQQISTAAVLKLSDTWEAFGSLDYSLEHNRLLESVMGLRYQDECLMLSLEYAQSRHIYNGQPTDHSIKARFSLRTIGQGRASHSLK